LIGKSEGIIQLRNIGVDERTILEWRLEEKGVRIVNWIHLAPINKITICWFHERRETI
jgi:hypothetical protein